ncbi:MAG: hypothetical protein R3307_07015 [Anaerolineales bacterium]|nr:hypothetical protein [Anaerolineales bacterium]
MQNSDVGSLRSHPSLLPLRAALIASKSEAPPRPLCTDPDEQQALQLISRMKTDYRKPLPFTSWKDDETLNSFRFQEVIRSNV